MVAMKNLLGMPGTGSGLVLQIGQFMFVVASINVRVTSNNFSNYTVRLQSIVSTFIHLFLF